AHAGYFAATALYVGLKLRIVSGSAPALSASSWTMLRANILATASYTFGPLWLHQVAPLLRKTTLGDWTASLFVASLVASLAAWRRPRVSASPRPRVFASQRLIAALLFSLAAYLPAWLWHITLRHHLLPSVGLFAGGAVCLAWILEKSPSRAVPIAALLLIGAVTCVFAAAGRGESRFWEESFGAKKQL